MASAKNNLLISSQGPHFHAVQLKPTIKVQITNLRRNGSIQLSLHKEPPEVGLAKKLTGSLY